MEISDTPEGIHRYERGVSDVVEYRVLENMQDNQQCAIEVYSNLAATTEQKRLDKIIKDREIPLPMIGDEPSSASASTAATPFSALTDDPESSR